VSRIVASVFFNFWSATGDVMTFCSWAAHNWALCVAQGCSKSDECARAFDRATPRVMPAQEKRMGMGMGMGNAGGNND